MCEVHADGSCGMQRALEAAMRMELAKKEEGEGREADDHVDEPMDRIFGNLREACQAEGATFDFCDGDKNPGGLALMLSRTADAWRTTSACCGGQSTVGGSDSPTRQLAGVMN